MEFKKLKGKTVFTLSERDAIIDLIKQKLATDSEQQKKIRNNIRTKYDFYSNEDHGIPIGNFTLESFQSRLKELDDNRAFWHMQLHPNKSGEFTRDMVLSMLNDHKLVGMGEVWDNDRGQPNIFKERLKIGDIIMIRSHGPLALVEVVSDYFDNENSDVWFEIARSIRILDVYNESKKKELQNIGIIDWKKGLFLATTFESANKSEFLKKWYESYIGMKNNLFIDRVLQVLSSKKQIILQGPPGTGKTRTAHEIAYQLIFDQPLTSTSREEKLKDMESTDQYTLVQFHPSYSYEDFVRGIIAESQDEKVVYTTRNKVFGELAAKAQKNLVDSRTDVEDLSKDKRLSLWFEHFVDRIQQTIEDKGKWLIGDTTTYIFASDEDAFRYTGDKWNNSHGVRMKFLDLFEIITHEVRSRQGVKQMSGISGLAKQHASYFHKVVEQFHEFMEKEIKDQNKDLDTAVIAEEVEKQSRLKNYVLVIDEINRANLPVVLGELIYALEYRGKVVDSMYDLQGDKSIVVPDNLYIIGTMNTADRSVGHIDYAIRRRFAFVDVLPNPEPIREFALPKFEAVSKLFIKNYDAYVSEASGTLERADSLSSDFRPEEVWIGHSYFITKADGDEGEKELSLKMKYEVIPLLKEYIKDGILTEEAEEAVYQL